MVPMNNTQAQLSVGVFFLSHSAYHGILFAIVPGHLMELQPFTSMYSTARIYLNGSNDTWHK